MPHRPSNDTRTSRKTRPSFSVELNVPSSWRGLTDAQFLYLAELLAGGTHTVEETEALFAARLALEAGATLRQLRDANFDSALDTLCWIAEPPSAAVRPDTLRGFHAVHPQLSGVPFSSYLSAENYYQGYLATQQEEAVDAIGALLYPGIGTPLTPAERFVVILWASSLKAEYTRLFPNLFSSDPDTFATPPEQREVMNAQIRALTGGDVTKTADVLSADTLTALTELDAKAREAKELKKRSE